MLIETQDIRSTESVEKSGIAQQTNAAIARFLPSLTDLAFLMPLMFMFVKLGGARTLLGDGDTGWHIRTGEWILAHRQVPAVDIFSFSRPGAPWFAWEWLWDLLAAILFRSWGMASVVVASALVICLSSALLFRLVRRSCDNGFVAIAVTLLATGGCAIHWLARPHLFTLLFLTITLHLTTRAREGRIALLGWLVPLTLLWTNLHGGFFVVFLVLFCYIGSDLLNALIESSEIRRREFLLATKPWLVVFAACLLVTLVNPYGWNLHRHVIDYITDPYQLQHIAEFQSMDFHAPVVVYFEPLMFLAIIGAVNDFRRRRFADVFLSMGFLHLGLIAQRNLPLFSIAAAPAVARFVIFSIEALSGGGLNPMIRKAGLWFSKASRNFDETDRIGRVYLTSFLVAAGICSLILLTPALPGLYNNKLASTYDPKVYPEKALSLLRGSDTQRIFADDEWGDYLIYNLYPSKRVFVDGRSDFYGDKFCETYIKVLDVRWDWQKTLDKYGIDTILLSPKFALSSTLKVSPDWRVVYDDHNSLIFRRKSGKQDSLVTSNEGKQRDRAITNTNTNGSVPTQHPINKPTKT